MNVIASAPQLAGSFSSPIPAGGALATGKQDSLPGNAAANLFPFLSLLSWLTDDVPPAGKADAPVSKPDKKVQPDRRDPQIAIAIESPVITPGLKAPIQLPDTTPPTSAAQATTGTPTSSVPVERDTARAAVLNTIAFSATLTDRAKESGTPPVAPASAPTSSVAVQQDAPLVAVPNSIAFPAALTDCAKESGTPPVAPVSAPTASVAVQQDTPPVAVSNTIVVAATSTDRAKESDTPLVAPVSAPTEAKEVGPDPVKPILRAENLAKEIVSAAASVEISPGRPQSSAASSAAHSETPKAELKTEINVPVLPQPTRAISLKLTGAESGSVDVRIIERAGKVQVNVRTPDTELARSLQSNLGDLVGRLDKRGFDAETWIPGSQSATAARNPEGPENHSGQGSKQSPGEGSQRGQGGHQGGRGRHGRAQEFIEQFETTKSFTEENKETNVNSN